MGLWHYIFLAGSSFSAMPACGLLQPDKVAVFRDHLCHIDAQSSDQLAVMHPLHHLPKGTSIRDKVTPLPIKSGTTHTLGPVSSEATELEPYALLRRRTYTAAFAYYYNRESVECNVQSRTKQQMVIFSI